MHSYVEDAYNSNAFHADCSNCFGLCCIALAFEASSDFPVDKGAGIPCKNLKNDFSCGIHKNLNLSGYTGCTVFDCLGAGQKVSQQTFGGISWKEQPQSALKMFQVLPVMQQLHEMLLYLTQAIQRGVDAQLAHALRKSRMAIETLTLASADVLLSVNLPEHRRQINELLVQVSDQVRLESGRFNKNQDRKKGPNFQGQDLIGKKFRGRDMKGSLFRGAYLIETDFKNADLRNSDFIGADLRNTDLTGADLRGSIFLTQMQLNSAQGDCRTKLPGVLAKPAHWRAVGLL
ncbi:pentapeptide repeat-containing protein [Planococcus sp. CPCC 101016]|uniref:pentapeptide repeat-containing protein n=1 Tax=Planococcus sp. CPCC 101016 TaxID=2599617 RepID=UPI0011B7C6E7|nr:pentapeptide repeat-containing protein [Planococcus sp. CPCC 101016]TWT08442.1 pentapeptide repeat-containing protein [Planococcus sp. CPCC 101016]